MTRVPSLGAEGPSLQWALVLLHAPSSLEAVTDDKRRLLPHSEHPLPPGTALQCYSCKAQASNHDCLHVRNCTGSETYCWTEHIREWPRHPRKWPRHPTHLP